MPKAVFGKSSNIPEIKTDTSLFEQKPYLRTNSIESNIEEDIAMKNQFMLNKLRCPIEKSDAVFKSYVASGLNNPTIIRNTSHVDFKDKNLDNAQFVEVNSLPAV